MESLEEFFGEVIHGYSRAQALEDGFLVDVTEAAREAGFKIPVALTSAAYAEVVAMTEAAERMGCDTSGRLWDVLYMLHFAIKEISTGGNTVRVDGDGELLLYQLHVVNRTDEPELVMIKSICGPSDDGSPCITIMLPHED